MEIENRKSTFLRDLIVRILLIVLFIFLLMYLFPMPNLNAFYDAVFNDNIQTMKDAAEKWYSTDRMPKKDGASDELTLQDMLDKKLVLPFVDKDGNSCDTHASYVKVTKVKDKYKLKVSLTCGSQTDYIVEYIGCYNFCKDEKCTKEVVQQVVQPQVQPTKVVTPTTNYVPSKPTPTPTPTPENPVYKTIYEYRKAKTTESWTLLDWQNNKMEENENLVLANIRTQYRGEKKVTQGSTLYKHIKYAYKDNWSVDADWTTDVKTITDNTKLYASRTLYRGYKPVVTNQTKYKHISTTVNDNWTTTDWTNQIKATSSTVKLVDTRYKVQKTTQKTGTTTKTVWGDWTKDYTWRTSKPGDTSSKQWGSVWDTRTTGANTVSSRVKVDDDYTSTVALSNNSTYTYVFTGTSMDPCTTACNGRATIRTYHYIRYKNVTSTTGGTKEYRYLYRTKKTVTEDTLGSQNTDTKWVSTKSELNSYISKGYMLIETQYKYKVNNATSTSNEIWTDSITPPAGYTYTGIFSTQSITKYELSSNWYTNPSALGEYTYDIQKVTQYKYKYNEPTREIVDTIWTESKVSPQGYVYTDQIKDTSSTSTVKLDHWVDTKEALGEYRYNVEARRQYQYKKRTTSTYYETKWAESSPGADWTPTGQSKTYRVK